MSAGISRRASAFALFVLVLGMNLAALETAIAQNGSKTLCPLRYEHADPRREDGSAVALRLTNRERLGTLSSDEVIDEQSLSTVWQRCIDEGLPEFRDDGLQDTAACIMPIASSFGDELRKVSQTVPTADRGTEALSRFRRKWRAIDSAVATDPLAVCAIKTPFPTNSPQAAKFVVEVLNVMALEGVDPATQRGYLAAVHLDAQSEHTVGCNHGCARLYWMRRVLER